MFCNEWLYPNKMPQELVIYLTCLYTCDHIIYLPYRCDHIIHLLCYTGVIIMWCFLISSYTIFSKVLVSCEMSTIWCRPEQKLSHACLHELAWERTEVKGLYVAIRQENEKQKVRHEQEMLFTAACVMSSVRVLS